MTILQAISGFIMSTVLAAIVAVFFKQRVPRAGDPLPPTMA